MVTIAMDQIQSERLFPITKANEQAVPLSLIDATTSDFLTTSAVWLFEQPDACGDQFHLADHLRQSLRITLDAYPMFCGLLKGITTVNPADLPDETLHFAPHARRYGRIYTHYGTSQDPGVHFVIAKTAASLDAIWPASRVTNQPCLDHRRTPLDRLIPSVRFANAIKPRPVDETGLLPPVLAIQLTELGCGGFALAISIVHPLSDIQSLVYFVKDWARISRWIISGSNTPKPALFPMFEPSKLDSMAAGDINGPHPNPAILEQTTTLPLHRYDWWISTAQCPWSAEVPDIFQKETISPVGKAMPWSEYDSTSPVSHHLIHFDRAQVEYIWEEATSRGTNDAGASRISRHDAILAHIWSCINRARKRHDDSGPVHCILTYGSRAAFQLPDSFIGSPSMMINIEITGKDVALSSMPDSVHKHKVAQCIRTTINQINRPAAVAAHLHSIAFETSPQRIWQTFIGQRHLLVTSWARAGVYDVDFGLHAPASPGIRYVEGVLADIDGLVLIKDAPPLNRENVADDGSWTKNGVDVSVHIRSEDMQRLIHDPLFLPRCSPQTRNLG